MFLSKGLVILTDKKNIFLFGFLGKYYILTFFFGIFFMAKIIGNEMSRFTHFFTMFWRINLTALH